MRLTDREFSGTIIKGDDPKNCGRYRVLIQELMYNIYDKEEGFIYCNNQVTNCRNSSSDSGIYGQYFPLHPGTKVIVKFNAEDYETGYIDRIISDHHENSLAFGEATKTKDRDQLYQLVRTIAEDLIAVTHDTTNPATPSNSMFFYHKKDNVRVTFDKDGIHIYTKKDLDEQIDGEAFIKIDKDTDVVLGQNLQITIAENNKIKITGDNDISIGGNSKISIKGDNDLIVKGNNKIEVDGDNDLTIKGGSKISIGANCDLTIKGNSKIGIKGNCDLSVGGNCIIAATGKCDINATSVNLNCGPPANLSTLTQNTAGVAKELNNILETSKKAATSVDKTLASVNTALTTIKGLS